MDRNDCALLLFTRSPEAEARAKGISPVAGARLFSRILASWRDAARAAGVRLVVATPASCRRKMELSPIGGDALLLTQPPGGFGRRLESSAARTISLGFRKIVVVGGDSPAVAGEDLIGVFERLEARSGVCVLGPSMDGGVSLVGLTRASLPLLGAMTLRCGDQFRRSLEFLSRGGFETHVLPARGEIDSPGDLARALEQGRDDSAWTPYRFLLAEALRPEGEFVFSPPCRILRDRVLRLPARAPPRAA